jgi:hypothetical protein
MEQQQRELKKLFSNLNIITTWAVEQHINTPTLMDDTTCIL